jgi:hypothetical protein
MKVLHALLLAPLLSWPLAAFAQTADAFPGANADNGRELHAEKRCGACHSEKTGREEAFIYQRDDRRVKTVADLKTTVARCNSELRLELFPEEEIDIAAWLNQQYYKLAR